MGISETNGRGQGTPGGANRRGGYTPSPPGRWRSKNAVEPGPSPLHPGAEDQAEDPPNYNQQSLEEK